MSEWPPKNNRRFEGDFSDAQQKNNHFASVNALRTPPRVERRRFAGHDHENGGVHRSKKSRHNENDEQQQYDFNFGTDEIVISDSEDSMLNPPSRAGGSSAGSAGPNCSTPNNKHRLIDGDSGPARPLTPAAAFDFEDDSPLAVRAPPSRPPARSNARSIESCPGMSFDFAADPKVASVRDTIASLIAPSSSRNGAGKGPSREEVAAYVEKTLRDDELNNKGKEKKKKASHWERRGLASLNDFKMASGRPIVKEMKPVMVRRGGEERSEESDGASASEVLPARTRSGGFQPPMKKNSFNNQQPTNKKPLGGGGFRAPDFIKNGMEAMGMSTDGGGKDEVKGLRAEPSLKHFDEHIISLIESEIMSSAAETGWADVAGLEGAKKALREIVVLPFKRPDVFKGIRAPPKGVLLFGPPGTGKTMIGRCVASQCSATFFNISASSLTSKWVGEGEKLVRALFAVARLKLPSVIFIDEIDSLLSARSESEHESSRRIKTEFLVQLDGVATCQDERLLVLGATNRPQELDEAARRRFAKRLYIALPEKQARVDMVRRLLTGMRHSLEEADYVRCGEMTDGYSGADMRQLCAEAAMGPIRDVDNCSSQDIETIDEAQIRPISVRDFEDAVQVVRPTVVPEDLVAYAAWDKKFGCLP